MIDISVFETLEAYLLDRKIILKDEPYSIRYCKGGVSCTVAFVCAGDRQLIVKQGLEKLKVKETWLCDPNRMNIEQESNCIYHDLAPDCAPEVYGYDSDNYIYWREAVPDSWRMWKEELMSGILNFPSAQKVITTLLAVHNYCASDPAVREQFKNKEIFYNLRISPYIEFVLEKYPQLRGFAQPIIRLLLDSEITLIHGDFSPKNIMTDSERISILDYEVAHMGHPSFDLAFFTNHFILKAVKNKVWAEAYINMLEYMMELYFSGVTCMDARELEKDSVRLLALMMLARVDGKSPAEYITEEKDKELIRKCAFSMIEAGMDTYHDTAEFITAMIKKERQEESND